MITVGKTEIKNLTDEFTIREFEAVTNILNNEKELEIDRYKNLFKYLGVTDEDLDELGFLEFGEKVKEFNDGGEHEKGLQRTIELNGFVYSSYKEGEDFKLMVKDMAKIERLVEKKPKGHLVEIIAVLFKGEHLTKAEHYADAHIAHKSKLIEEAGLTVKFAIPFLVIVTTQLAEAGRAMLLDKADAIIKKEKEEKAEEVKTGEA